MGRHGRIHIMIIPSSACLIKDQTNRRETLKKNCSPVQPRGVCACSGEKLPSGEGVCAIDRRTLAFRLSLERSRFRKIATFISLFGATRGPPVVRELAWRNQTHGLTLAAHAH